ncbi:MAG: glycine cleavage system protein H [Candidatus Phytoplasma sp.]|nr:glycine cleavage system protein H [Phytoplasma sp.]
MKKFDKNHFWVEVNGNVAKIGLTSFKLSDLGTLNFVSLPEVGSNITKGEAFGNYESSKTTGDFIAPVTAKVVKVNQTLLNDPSSFDMMSADEAILELESFDEAELNDLMTQQSYDTYLENL